MPITEIRTALIRRITFLTLLVVLSAALITGTIYLEERVPEPLLDKSINFHSVVMHDTNKIVMYIDTFLHDFDYISEPNTTLQQISDIEYALNKFLSGTSSLYKKYEFAPGIKTLTKLREESRQLSLAISRTSGNYPIDSNILKNRVRTVVDGLQQLYRLHESDDDGIRKQLVLYQQQRAEIILPLITAILLLTAFLGYHHIRRILQALEVQTKLEKELRESAASHQQILNGMNVVVGLFTVDGRFLDLDRKSVV